MKERYKYSGARRLHSLIAEKVLGKPLPAGAVVHHVDGDGHNNNNNNLVICPSQKYHALLHQREEALRFTGNPNMRRCNHCAKWVDPSNTVEVGVSNPKRGDGFAYHRKCNNEYQRYRKHGIKPSIIPA